MIGAMGELGPSFRRIVTAYHAKGAAVMQHMCTPESEKGNGTRFGQDWADRQSWFCQSEQFWVRLEAWAAGSESTQQAADSEESASSQTKFFSATPCPR